MADRFFRGRDFHISCFELGMTSVELRDVVKGQNCLSAKRVSAAPKGMVFELLWAALR